MKKSQGIIRRRDGYEIDMFRVPPFSPTQKVLLSALFEPVKVSHVKFHILNRAPLTTESGIFINSFAKTVFNLMEIRISKVGCREVKGLCAVPEFMFDLITSELITVGC